MSLEVGQVFAGYTILRVLGAGGMGAVYLAAHPRLPRKEALKVLPPALTSDPEYRARFLREADLAAALSHPHIVRIYDRGEENGQFWLSMDYVAGTDAARLVHEHYPHGMRPDDVVQIVTAVGSALDYAHHRGLLHRDVKPANILLHEPDGQPRRVFLGDFGVARRIDDVTGLTATNVTMGTATYAAPEQLRGEPLDGRTDQYSLACTVFHLLTGAPPFDDANPAMVISQHVTAPPPAIGVRRPELAALDQVFATAMAKNPADRFATCQDFANHLSQHLAVAAYPPGTPPVFGVPVPIPPAARRRPRALLGALAAVLMLVLALGVTGVIKLAGHHKATAHTAGTPTVASKPTGPTANRAANTGPFTGVYRAEFGKVTDLDDIQAPGASSATEDTYAVRSLCGSIGCVATATHLTGPTTLAQTLVFDQIGDRWVAVAIGNDKCQGADSEFWESFTLQPSANGTFTGEFTSTSANDCAGKHKVTFTRTGDVDLDTLPDPANLSPRVVSPAEALHGHYRAMRTLRIPSTPEQTDYAVSTECLRTGDRCMSFFHSSSGAPEPLVFDDGSWVYNKEFDAQCLGASMHVSETGQFPLPQPTRDPITLLTGHGSETQTGACAISVDYDETFTRTID
ncbi:MAG: serine/threonine protein kinase [Mycobacterium sp.]|uniref:serine/threonine-protein kinase n=1 Tax=Mycobacterium sp. TaxID=1785 RepID=UPI001EB3DF34|nr:serine/threonine-protein kinase [Mycobacterium sp.]MBW0016716.1 serine/threonine protein kinase [Mycobacterium sp.]